MTESNFPKRKQHRLSGYDYSKSGYYHVTICTEGRKPVLSTVGRGLAPAANTVTLTGIGKIAEEQLLLLEKRYSNVTVEDYIIMPDHIHLILIIKNEDGLINNLRTKKSISTIVGQLKRSISKEIGFPIWQKSFYEHIIRDENDYLEKAEYILNNPLKWIVEKK